MPANRFAELRTRAGLSQRGLMARVAVLSKGAITSPSYLADVERGHQSASPLLEELCAEILGCSVFDFYSGPRLMPTDHSAGKEATTTPEPE